MSYARLGLEAERPAARGPIQVAAPVTPSPVTQTPPPAAAPSTTFDQLGLTPELLRSVAAQGYTEPTPVQAQSIPIILAGRDLLSSAQTGTGKTAAFVLPILQLLNATRPAPRAATPGQQRLRGATGLPIRCLVLTPTRELALQVEESVRTYGSARPVRSTTIYGGVGFQPQVVALKHGPEIVVATPGRLLDHAGRATIDLSSVEILVLDEADRMLDMGFIHDIRRVLALLPPRRQNLLFSATFSDEIRELAGGILDDPAEVQVARRNAPIELVRQVVHPVDRDRKRELLTHLIQTGRIDRALVFTRTKHGANRLAEQLVQDGIRAAAIHGNKSQSQRVAALNDFKSGRVAILVATEIAARGLDIDALPHVVNYELPTVPEDYVHRIGRTGRAGMEGDAVSFVCVDETGLLDDIQRLLRQPIPREVVPGFEVDRSIRPEAIRGVRKAFGFAPAARSATKPSRAHSARPGPGGPAQGGWTPKNVRPARPTGRIEQTRPTQTTPRIEATRALPSVRQGQPQAARPAAGTRPDRAWPGARSSSHQQPRSDRPWRAAQPSQPARPAQATRSAQALSDQAGWPAPGRPAQVAGHAQGRRHVPPFDRRAEFDLLPGERFARRPGR